MLQQTAIEDDIAGVLTAYLEQRFPGLAPVRMDASLLASGAVDSLGILELTMFLGERFGISLDDDDFVPENLETPGRLVDFVVRKRAG